MLIKHIEEATDNMVNTLMETLIKQDAGRDALTTKEIVTLVRITKLKLYLKEGLIDQKEFIERGGKIYD